MEMTVVAGFVMTGLAVKTVLDGMTGAVTVCFIGTVFFVVVIIFCLVDDFSESVCCVSCCNCCIEFIMFCGWVRKVLFRFCIYCGFLFINVINCGKVISDLMLVFYGWLDTV